MSSREELLRRLAELNYDWVEEMVEGGAATDDDGQPVDVTPEQEEPYLQDVRDLLDGADDLKGESDGDDGEELEEEEEEDGEERTLTAAFRYDPHQLRDSEGQWSKSPGGAIGDALSDWRSQSADTSRIGDAELVSVGSKIGDVMRRDGTSMADPLAFHSAATEALADSDITPRQFVTALDAKYGTSMASRIEEALQKGDGAPTLPRASAPEAPAPSARSTPDTSVRDFPARGIEATDEEWKSIENGWTPDQKKALQTYTSMAYSDINRALREDRGDRGIYAKAISDVRSAMTGSPVSQTTYRRTGGNSFGKGYSEFATTDELRSLVGTTVESKSFLSSTVDESILKDHPAVVHMEIEVPRGSSTAWVHNVGLDHDGELLLDAGTRYEIVSVEPMGTFETRMKVRVVP